MIMIDSDRPSKEFVSYADRVKNPIMYEMVKDDQSDQDPYGMEELNRKN